jgi:thiamine biosynthesis lipoprotein
LKKKLKLTDNDSENKKIFIRFGVLLIVAALLFLAAVFGKRRETSGTKYDFAMGTAISVTAYMKGNNASAEDITKNIVDTIKNLDEEVISWRDEGSELAAVNGAAVGEALNASDTLFTAVDKSLRICEDSGGALDITLRPLLDCWNIESATTDDFRVPDDEEIKESLNKTGYEKLLIDDAENTIKKTDDITIDLGATGKGYALDVVRDYLDENNIQGAIVTVGGSVMVYGDKTEGDSWKVGIRNPKGGAEDMVGYLEISGVDYICVSTSGDYEKYVEYDGKRYHHILDRTTGYPAESGLSSVTVMCSSGLDSDGLSTACFVLGEEGSKALLEKYGAEALFIDTEGNITMTDGMEKYYREQ